MWMKVDDGLHAHRKTRAVTKSHETKSRDAAPMGLWVLAGSWSAQNGTDGWVPEDELDRWDDDWRALVNRLVRTGWWWPHKRAGEPGYGFTDWHDYNDPADLASKAGTYGNHVRWHVNEAKVDPACEHCPTEPDPAEDRGDVAPESGGDRGAISGGESRSGSGAIALPEPEPDPNPTRTRGQASSDRSDITPERFDEFWEAYGNKVGRKGSIRFYRAALKKPGITDDLLISAAADYRRWCDQTGTFIKNPQTWLNGEHWRDERHTPTAPPSNIQGHLALVEQLSQPTLPQIGGPA